MIVMHDSNSDGMCGFVTMKDESGATETVRWSVSELSKFKSQSAAIDAAVATLERHEQNRGKIASGELVPYWDESCRSWMVDDNGPGGTIEAPPDHSQARRNR